MRRQTRRFGLLVAISFGVLVLLPLVFGNVINFYTEWLWFDSVGQLSTYLKRLWLRVGVWLAGFLAVVGVLVVNWIVIPRPSFDRVQFNLRNSKHPRIKVNAGVVIAVLIIAAFLVGLTMASEAADKWMTVLSYLNATPFGLDDPIFGRDVGFYVFKLPFFRFLVNWLMGLVVVTLIGNVIIYLLAGEIRQPRAASHFSLLGSLFLLGRAAGYQVRRLALLSSSRGVVFGAGYTDVHARLPFFHLLTGVVIVGALVLLVNLFTRRWQPSWMPGTGRLLLIVGGTWLVLSLLGQFYPNAIQRFTVEPNELAMERPYIEHNIRFTRYAYGLSDVKETEFDPSGELTKADLEANTETLDNVRLWDWRPLQATFEQLQEIRTYYTFADVDIDRYIIDGELQQVNLAARELDVTQMREDAQTWINRHLIYTHGYGLCLSPTGEINEDGLPSLLVRDIPPKSADPVFAIERPEIYFGEKTTNYVIVNTDEDEFNYPIGDQNAYTRYEGPDGVVLGGLLRRLAFALRFNSSPILLSGAVRPESRILFHRALSDRVNTLAPMLWYDPDPYPVVADGRLVWLYDAYTWSKRFPYSEPTRGLNYIRNSVKVAIDAYTGETTFYVVDPSDPLIQTYQAIFPDLFTSGEEMDSVLRKHWRYPEQLFYIQADRYAAYHMEDPRVFYNQEDLWDAPTEIRGGEEIKVAPYYVTAQLPDADEVEFLMMRPYVPAGKQNMIAWFYAESDGEDYGQLGVYKFAKESLVYGPMQIESRVDQDPLISQQLSLWDQHGSSVNRGNLIVIPIDDALLYVEPIYLQAEASQMPELKRVVVAYKDRVVMADNLSTGLGQVVGVEPREDQESTALLPTEVRDLAQAAQSHYEAAQLCLQQEDWSCYGKELKALERTLEALVAATEAAEE
jgi:hypothetical protein